MPQAVADAAAITIAATVGTAPLMAIHFEQVSLAALPANLLAAPAIAPVMWLGILAAAAAQIAEPLAAPFSALTAPLLVYLQRVAHVTAATPVSVVEIRASPATIAIGWAALAAATGAVLRRWSRAQLGQDPDPPAGAAAAWTRRGRSGTRRAARSSAPLARSRVRPPGPSACSSSGSPGEARRWCSRPTTSGCRSWTWGRGMRRSSNSARTSVLVDTGPPEGPILERLEESGVKRLDALVLTHAETDHEGAALAVIERFSPRFVVDGGAGWPSAVQRALPGAIARARARLHAPAAGDVIALGQIRLEVLWPPPRATSWRADGNPNNSALVARLEAGGLSMLLAADAESEITAAARGRAGGRAQGRPSRQRRSRAAGTPGPHQAANRGDRGRARQPLRPSGAVDARGARGDRADGPAHRPGRHGPLARRAADACGWSDERERPGADTSVRWMLRAHAR